MPFSANWAGSGKRELSFDFSEFRIAEGITTALLALREIPVLKLPCAKSCKQFLSEDAR
jgi:hypothetical protein